MNVLIATNLAWQPRGPAARIEYGDCLDGTDVQVLQEKVEEDPREVCTGLYSIC